MAQTTQCEELEPSNEEQEGGIKSNSTFAGCFFLPIFFQLHIFFLQHRVSLWSRFSGKPKGHVPLSMWILRLKVGF